ncbi:hypothetical protein VNI00_003074 [Paramarasmius palmivorus]|uniref:Uncharacterized protein n=1 Tax=Paramarasmius palmivorus TaxID=297713 RepID=A0AAW0DZ16_9AGAR
MDTEKGRNVAELAREYYRKWWKNFSYQRQYPLLLPITSDPSKILPNDWVVVQITPTNGKGEVLKMMYDIWKALEEDDNQKVFDDDIINNTSKSVTCNLVKEEDLAAFKQVLYEWRDQFACLARR